MCGIIGVVRRRSTRVPPDLTTLVGDLETACARLEAWRGSAADLVDAAALVESVDAALRGVPGVRSLLTDKPGALAVDHRSERLTDLLADVERLLDTEAAPSDVETVNAALLRAKDAAWAVRHDRLRTARAVADLAGSEPSAAAIEAFNQVQIALSAIDRLDVRGRDSAGLHLLVRNHALDLSDPSIKRLLDARTRDPLFGNGSVRTPDGMIAF